jgi:hypothetical protein
MKLEESACTSKNANYGTNLRCIKLHQMVMVQ